MCGTGSSGATVSRQLPRTGSRNGSVKTSVAKPAAKIPMPISTALRDGSRLIGSLAAARMREGSSPQPPLLLMLTAPSISSPSNGQPDPVAQHPTAIAPLIPKIYANAKMPDSLTMSPSLW